MSPLEKAHFKVAALEAYGRGVSYLEKWFSYEDSIYKSIAILSLSSADKLSFDALVKIASALKLTISSDEMYEEYCSLRHYLLNSQQSNLTADMQWANFLATGSFRNLSQIVGKAFSLPVSNAFAERIFSIMKNIMHR